MDFWKDSRQIYRVRPLEEFEWLIHGFGTRFSGKVEHVATAHQAHSSRVIDASGRTGCLGDADALISGDSAVAVKTADCFPILLADPVHRAVAAVHAGWRGTAAGILRNAMQALSEKFGTKPEDLHAAIGPGIQVCCYEIGPEVSAEFGRTGRIHLDLAEIHQQQLTQSGVASSRIYNAGMCTSCGLEEFYSWRREKEQAGRMWSFAGVR